MKDINDKSGRMKRIVKKGAGISLCAVLAGGLAAGAFEGVNYITGWNQSQEVQAASKDVALTLTGSESKSDSTAARGSLDVSDIAAEAMPSVVSITTQSVQEVQEYYGMFGNYGYAPQSQEVEISGSGIIIGKNDDLLFIATNYHVVEDADTVSAAFADGNACEAQLRGFDEARDLAVVSVSLDDISKDTMDEISVAKIGSSDDLKVGEQVVAIGNALGYGQSVTTGIVSAKNRRLNSTTSSFESEDTENGVNLIQTDAAINPGNSGGALLNMDGEVVGINSAKLASTEVEGMCYAIAISDVSDVLENLMNEEPREKLDDADHGVLGISGRTVSQEGQQVYGIPGGVFVAEVTEDGAAEKAGLKKNYVITEFNGKVVSSIEQLQDMLKYYEPGEKTEVTVQIPDGDSYKEDTITVTLDKNTAPKETAEDEDLKEREDFDQGQDRQQDNILGGDDEVVVPDDENPFAEFFNDWE